MVITCFFHNMKLLVVVPVPLQSVEVQVDVKDHVATVVSTLLYQNKEEKPIEAVFVFPMPSEAAVCHFSAKVGQTLIVAEVKEKKQAREEYDDALSSGQQAFLLEESDQSPDIFSMSVGSLPPGESASIRLEYVTELDVQADEALRFCLPAVLNPRYQPTVTSVPSSLVPYDLTFLARVQSARPISKVESNCTMDPLEFLSQDQTAASVKLAAGHKFDRDVELLIYYKDTHEPSAVVEAGQASAKAETLMGDPAVMLSLYPEFPKDIMSSVSSSGEFVFLLDRSGSMSGGRIASARDTLLLLLKSLPMGCFFNIYSFGSTFEQIFPESVEYKQETMEEALKKVEMMQANLGGTEILAPLERIYSQNCIPNQPRQLFVFTDGEVGNTKEVINLVKSNSGSHRCFSFGIGEGASTALINGLAKEGGGHAQFITGSDRMQPKVIQSLRFAMQPAVVDISVKWDLPKGVSATVLSPPLTSIFQGQRSLLYAQLTGQVLSVLLQESVHLCLQSCLFFLTVYSMFLCCTSHGPHSHIIRTDSAPGTFSQSLHKTGLNLRSTIHQPGGEFCRVSPNSCVKAVRLYASYPLQLREVSLAPARGQAPGSSRNAPGSSQMLPPIPSRSVVDIDCADVMFRAADCDNGALPSVPESKAKRDPLLELVSLQKASGCWELEPALAKAVGKTSKDLEDKQPSAAKKEVWATILALVWLHGLKADAKDEWELLVMKAVTWLQSQNGNFSAEDIIIPIYRHSLLFSDHGIAITIRLPVDLP
uniref:von Willebrand factor A domain containing 5A n=1 Tax=Neogobius melanostomus TaxID=47308 RepID=A0A8C6U190_9GOBI